MSKVKLGSVGLSIPIVNDVNYYVGAIVSSKSGFLKPRIISDSQMIDSIYGNFKYSYMYKRLIEEGIPVLISPLLTGESDYNRSSIRLNKPNSYVKYCYPRYHQDYNYVEYGGVTVISFTDVEELVIPTRCKYFIPYQVSIQAEGGWEAVETLAQYSKDASGNCVITLRFDSPTSGLFVCEVFETEEALPDVIREIPFEGGECTFDIPNSDIPDIVVLDNENYNVTYSTELLQDSLGYHCHLIADSDEPLTAYTRTLPRAMYMTRSILTTLTQINHALGHNPLVKAQKTEDESTEALEVNVLYADDNNLQVLISTVLPGMKVIYNITESEHSGTTIEAINLGESTFATILDFSGMVNNNTWKTENDSYFMINVSNEKVLFLRNTLVPIPSNLYDRVVYLVDEHGDPISDLYELEGAIKENLIELMGEDCILSFRDECYKSLKDAISTVGREQFEADKEEWHDLMLDKLYANELHLGDYRILINFFNENYRNYDDYDELVDMLDLLLVDDRFHSDKLLILYYLPSYELNYYHMTGLKINNCFNATQDRLCELTEINKIIEFYSKIKGPTSENIKVTIEKDLDFTHYYYITVELDDFYENYYCYTIKNPDAPEDAIDIRLISTRSELIELVVYDYLLSNNKLINQLYVSEYGEEFNPERVIDIELPEGTFQLQRITNEDWIYEDYKNTLNRFKELNFHPDLFLVPEQFTDLQDQVKDIYQYIKGDEAGNPEMSSSSEEGIYSQAFVKIEWDDLYNVTPTKFLSYANRMLYFYGDFTIDQHEYPMFYPYIIHLIFGNLLRIPSENILCEIDKVQIGNGVTYHPDNSTGLGQPRLITNILNDTAYTSLGEEIPVEQLSSIEELLDIGRVNYLKYDNLRYYYLGLQERLNQSNNFVARFCCSKVSRAFYEWTNEIHTLPYHQLSRYVSDLVQRLKGCMPYVDSIHYELNPHYKDRTMEVNIYMQIKSMVNKTYRISYLLKLI